MLSFLNSVVGVGGLGSAANSSITLVNSNSPNTNEINEIFNEIEDRDPRSQQVEILNNHLWKHARIMEGAEKMLSVPDMQDFVRQQVETELFNATSRVDAITAKRNEILITILKSGPGSTAGSIFKLAYIANTNETYKIFDYTSSMGPWKQVNILDHYLRTQLRMLEGAEKMLSAPDMTESLRQQIETELSHVKSRIDAVAARRDEIHESKKSILMALRPVPTASSSSTFITSAAFTDEINEILNNIESRDPSQQVRKYKKLQVYRD
ncbi:hypothetical protein C8J56DRAFT_138886 [Mycena floridula]|nr:hypothetical protein C8J56DRAFT_138886 [Mycena floridula]